MPLSEEQMSDYKGAALMLSALPKAKELLADKGYDAAWFRAALAKRDVAVCIPSKSNRKVAIPYDVVLYKQRHKIENMFGRLKDWRRIHTRYDRCAHTYLSAICIAAAVAFWLINGPEPSLLCALLNMLAQFCAYPVYPVLWGLRIINLLETREPCVFERLCYQTRVRRVLSDGK